MPSPKTAGDVLQIMGHVMQMAARQQNKLLCLEVEVCCFEEEMVNEKDLIAGVLPILFVILRESMVSMFTRSFMGT